MRVLITGIAGFLGSHLADAFIKEGVDVVGIDDLSGGSLENIPDGCKFHIVDITDTESVEPKLLRDVDVVYHCAATAYEGLSVFSPGHISKNIYAGSANVFSAAIVAKVRRIVFCSSMARYGAITSPFREWDKPAPVDPYGLAKVGAENLLKMLAAVHGFEWCILVPHNIYGPRQKYDDPYRNVAAIMANRLLRGQPPIIYGDGRQVRCFSYVHDIIPAMLKASFLAQAHREIINIGPDEGEITINELASLLMEITNQQHEPIYVPGRPCEVKHATCSASKAQTIFGLRCKTPLRDGLIALVEDIRKSGPKPFDYRLNIEIESPLTPATWTDRLL